MRTALFGAAALAAALLTACASGPAPAHPSSVAPPATASAPAPATASTPAPAPATPAPRAAEVAVPKPPPNHCAHNRAAQLVLVRLDVQHLWLCDRSRTVYSSPVTSGMLSQYTETPTGHFHIQDRDTDTVLTLNTGATYDVKYWIPFDAPLFGFHDSSWQHFPYGSPKYKTAGSHGCIHLPLKTIAYLYRWVRIGADVAIS